MSAVTFSSDASEVINRKLVTKEDKNTEIEVLDYFEIDHCVQWIQENDFKRVALQFPDELLPNSVLVFEHLVKGTGVNIFILGDTSYGSCCVDEVAGQHVQADSIIHFGRSCLSPTERLPVLFVFGKPPLDVADCVEKLTDLVTDTSSRLILMFDVIYSHVADKITAELSEKFPNLLSSTLQVPDTEEQSKGDDSQILCRCRRKIVLPKNQCLEDFSILFVGREGLTLTNLIMNFNKCKFFTYDPVCMCARQELLNVNKALMKRYYLIERAKDAGIVGIVVGTLGVSNYLSVISRLKQLIKKAGKKSYTFVVGKLNVPKLANFMEIDVFVLVSCAQNSLIDSSEFYKPVVTPFEMEIACNSARDWTGDYFTDFTEILPGASGYVPIPEEIPPSERNDVSLITGKLRRHGPEETETQDENSSALISRNEALTVATKENNAETFLSERAWKGLERKLGESEVKKAVEGQRGIAAGYTTEPTKSDSVNS